MSALLTNLDRAEDGLVELDRGPQERHKLVVLVMKIHALLLGLRFHQGYVCGSELRRAPFRRCPTRAVLLHRRILQTRPNSQGRGAREGWNRCRNPESTLGCTSCRMLPRPCFGSTISAARLARHHASGRTPRTSDCILHIKD